MDTLVLFFIFIGLAILFSIIIFKHSKKVQITFTLFLVAFFLSLFFYRWLTTNRTDGDMILRTNAETSIDIVKLSDHVQLDAPVISQFPELERGCEVTSLAMLLGHAGVVVDKMELAEKIKKNPEPYERKNGLIYFGHPNDGFVGDIYTRNNPGLGVYHKPIADLAQEYLPDGSVLDITGEPFDVIKLHLSMGRPVWVIINIQYKKLDDSMFETWITPRGKIKITYHEHSVLITGYDDQFIYFNDPYDGKRKKAVAKDFIEAWEQMGSQAITYIPSENQ
ncbi:C39 family peptidase [Fervidibacillus halotolerans]